MRGFFGERDTDSIVCNVVNGGGGGEAVLGRAFLAVKFRACDWPGKTGEGGTFLGRIIY